ncbi:MAG: helix-turn-helix domain-containing protein [Terracidiphilus sp.]
MISELLSSAGGNRKRAAEELGISYQALLYILKQIESEMVSATGKIGAA